MASAVLGVTPNPVNVGATTTFEVDVSGGVEPISYQLQKEATTANFANINFTSNSLLTVSKTSSRIILSRSSVSSGGILSDSIPINRDFHIQYDLSNPNNNNTLCRFRLFAYDDQDNFLDQFGIGYYNSDDEIRFYDNLGGSIVSAVSLINSKASIICNDGDVHLTVYDGDGDIQVSKTVAWDNSDVAYCKLDYYVAHSATALYSWDFDNLYLIALEGNSNFLDVAGAITNPYTVPSAQLSDAGNYRYRVEDGA